MPQTARQNIEAVLRHLGITGIEIIREEEDRVYAHDTSDGALLRYVTLNNWMTDFDCFAKQHHGETVVASYRENLEPSLQICIHKQTDQTYYLEIDLDISPPTPFRPDRLIKHGFEVLKNSITRGKTDQGTITDLLMKKRGINV